MSSRLQVGMIYVTPNETIIKFLESLPQQTRESICAAFLLLPGSDNTQVVASGSDMMAPVRVLIKPDSSVSMAIAAASAIGVIDFFFSKEPLLASISDSQAATNPTLARLASRAPLTNAFAKRAGEEWAALRQGDLSYQALNAFEANPQTL